MEGIAMKFRNVFVILALLVITLAPNVLAEDDDIELFGYELEKLLNFGSGIVATALFVVTVMAYKRNKRSRLLYISAAFLLFAIKGYLGAHELFIDELGWVDPVASFLNFAILLSFFVGVLKR
jgi:hypothetical protein